MYFNSKEEIPLFIGETVEDPQYYLVGATGLKEIYFANMDQDVKGKGPGTYARPTELGRYGNKDSLDETSIIILGRKVTYDEWIAATVNSPKSPSAPVSEDDFGVEGNDEVGKA